MGGTRSEERIGGGWSWPSRKLVVFASGSMDMPDALDLSSLQQLWPTGWEHLVTRGDQREEDRQGPCVCVYVCVYVSLCVCLCVVSCSVVSSSLQLYGLQSTRLLCPWDFSQEEYLSGLPLPPPGDLPSPGTEPRSLASLPLQVDSLLLSHQGSREPLESSRRGLLPRPGGDPRGERAWGGGRRGVWAGAVCPVGSREGSLGCLGLEDGNFGSWEMEVWGNLSGHGWGRPEGTACLAL